MVERVKQIRAQLQFDSLGDLRVLVERHIGIVDARAVEEITPRVADSKPASRDCLGRRRAAFPREAGRIEVEVPCDHSPLRSLQGLDVSRI